MVFLGCEVSDPRAGGDGEEKLGSRYPAPIADAHGFGPFDVNPDCSTIPLDRILSAARPRSHRRGPDIQFYLSVAT